MKAAAQTTTHPLVAPLMWLGWEPVVKITAPLEWTLFTVMNAVAWGSQQREQLLQRPCWCWRFPSSLWITSIGNSETHTHTALYMFCFQEHTQSSTHCCLVSDILFFFFIWIHLLEGKSSWSKAFILSPPRACSCLPHVCYALYYLLPILIDHFALWVHSMM